MLVANGVQFYYEVEPVTKSMIKNQMRYSWKDECPVPYTDLVHLTLAHWGYDGQVHEGYLVVHKKLASEIVAIFNELFDDHFPIERMRLIDEYQADDELSMEDNNSSAFCCRAITNKPGIFSNHSYGIAIDINPKINPYIKGECILPASGCEYLDRTILAQGIITDADDNVCYQAFAKRGWDWGGHWLERKGYVDYQHFSKSIEDIE